MLSSIVQVVAFIVVVAFIGGLFYALRAFFTGTCPECGMVRRSRDAFCPKCGHKF